MNKSEQGIVIPANQLRVNETGVIINSWVKQYNGMVVLQTSRGLISLSDAELTWTDRDYDVSPFDVRVKQFKLVEV